MANFRDLQSNPRLKKIFDDRVATARAIRDFFWSRGFDEVNTPAMVRCADQEPHLSPVPVTAHDERGEARQFFLHTSPEYGMKKLLAAGYEMIFQICSVWRDYEESGFTHNTEFTMIEWYRAPGQLAQIMDDIEELFKFAAGRIGRASVEFDGKRCDLATTWERVSVRDLFARHVGVELNDFLTLEKLQKLCADLGYTVSDTDDFNDTFYKIFLNRIERHLGVDRPTIVYGYPIQMAALARPMTDDARYSERFELYICGLELANAFGELTDAEEQYHRFEAEQKERTAHGKIPIPIDTDLVDALKSIPTAAGIALGVDRMAMLLSGARNIGEAMFDTIQDQLNN